jgi:integrase
VRDRATIIQRKTGRPVQFEITEQTRASPQDSLNARLADRGPYIFPSRVQNQPHVTRANTRASCTAGSRAPGMDSSAYGTHSMRHTKAAQIYRKTGNLRAVQLLLGHEDREQVRYLGIEVYDALTLCEQVELWTLTSEADPASLGAPKHMRLPFSMLWICHFSQKGQ